MMCPLLHASDRYALWREWDIFNSDYVMFIGLNPSTADETRDDPTIRRCIGFAQDWGYGAVCMTNLFAYRARDPLVMKSAVDTIGPENDQWLAFCAKEASMIVAAWGVDGRSLGAERRRVKDRRQCCMPRENQRRLSEAPAVDAENGEITVI
jgi:hypothetical protein